MGQTRLNQASRSKTMGSCAAGAVSMTTMSVIHRQSIIGPQLGNWTGGSQMGFLVVIN